MFGITKTGVMDPAGIDRNPNPEKSWLQPGKTKSGFNFHIQNLDPPPCFKDVFAIDSDSSLSLIIPDKKFL